MFRRFIKVNWRTVRLGLIVIPNKKVAKSLCICSEQLSSLHPDSWHYFVTISCFSFISTCMFLLVLSRSSCYHSLSRNMTAWVPLHVQQSHGRELGTQYLPRPILNAFLQDSLVLVPCGTTAWFGWLRGRNDK